MRYNLGRKLKKLSDIMFIVAVVTNSIFLFYYLTYSYVLIRKISYIVIFVFITFIAWVFSEGLYGIGEILIAQDEILRGQKKDTSIQKEYKDDLLVEEFKNKNTDLDEEIVEKSHTSDEGFLHKLKNNKKVFYTLVIVCVLALGGGIYSKVKYDYLHQYDGIWRLSGNLEGDYYYIEGNKVEFCTLKEDEDGIKVLYKSVYRGERRNNSVAFTSYSYDYTDYNKCKTKKIHKVISLNRISYGAFHVDGKCYLKG